MRSSLEDKVGDVLVPAGFLYEPYNVLYPTYRKYTPDFVLGDVIVEVKGYFRAGDTQKYKAVKEELDKQGYLFTFVLQTPKKKVRKGSKLTMAEWCEKNGILWFDVQDLDLLVAFAVESDDDIIFFAEE